MLVDTYIQLWIGRAGVRTRDFLSCTLIPVARELLTPVRHCSTLMTFILYVNLFRPKQLKPLVWWYWKPCSKPILQAIRSIN